MKEDIAIYRNSNIKMMVTSINEVPQTHKKVRVELKIVTTRLRLLIKLRSKSSLESSIEEPLQAGDLTLKLPLMTIFSSGRATARMALSKS